MSKSPHLGKWYKKNKKTEDFDEINVIEVDGDIARTIGKNYSVLELQRSGWIRKEALAPDPFAIVKIDEIITDKSIIVPKNESVDTIKSNNVVEQQTQPIASRRLNVSQEQQFIIDALKLSNDKSTISFNIEVDVNYDIEKIAKLANMMSIPNNVVAEILSEDVIESKTAIHDAISTSIIDKLGRYCDIPKKK